MKNTAWSQLVPGSIINFIYKSKNESRAIKRWVIVIDRKYLKRTKEGSKKYFVGLQLHRQGQRPVMKPVIQKVITLLGGLAVLSDKAGQEYGKQINVVGLSGDLRAKDVTPGEFVKLFNRLRRVIGNKDIFRTYDLIQCRKRRVFLEENYGKIPQQAVKRLKQQIEIGTEVVVED